MEYRRWNGDKYLAGWKRGEERKDEMKIHNNLVEWAELPHEIQKYDLENIEDIPMVIKSQGMKICKGEE